VNDDVDRGGGRRVGAILWAGRYIILASVVIMLVLAWLYTASESKVYQASAILQVNVATNQPASSDTTATNQALAQNYATLVVSPGLLRTIRPNVDGGRLSVSTLQSRLTASALPTSSLVQLQATGPSPAAAQALAQQVATGFLAQLRTSAATRTAQLQTQDEQTISALSARIARLKAQPQTVTTAQQITSLNSSLQALITQNEALVASGLAQGTSATLSSPPVAAADPISPSRSLNLLGGLILGLVVGVALAWLRHLLRPEVQTADDAASEVGWRVLASIPLRPKLRGDDPTVIEAYRILSTRLSITMRQRQQRVVTVSGFGPQVGKTSTVKGLGEALAESGHRVLMVDGDMRAAALSSVYGLAQQAGLVDVLHADLPVESAIVPVEGTLSILPTRTSRINAARLLSGPQTEELMSELRSNYDYILLDTPPIAALADGLILASLSDIVVFVVRAHVTRPADLRAAASSLAQNATPVEGMVVFEERETDLYYPVAERGRGGVTADVPALATPAREE
jgi:capsular exopolysaccharide synthesis family protein